MDVKHHPVRSAIGQKRQGKHTDQKGGLRQSRGAGGGMFQIALAIQKISDCQKGRLGRNATQRITDGKIGVSLPRRRYRKHTSGQAGRHADKNSTGYDLSHAGPFGELEGNRCQPSSSEADHHCTD